MKDEEQQLIMSEGVSRPIPCSERSIQVKLARKIHESQRQKKNLDGLSEALAPGSTVGKVSPTTSVIEEPNRQEVWVRNSDIVKFGTKTERDTELTQYIERRPKKIYEKTIEQKINKHRRDLIRKNTGDKKIKRNRIQADDISVVSSGRSCISSAFNVARSLKMRIPKRNPKHDEAFINRPDLTQILQFSPSVPIAPPPPNPNEAGSSAVQMATPQIPTPIPRKTSKRQLTISETSDSDTSSVRKSKRTLKQKKSSQSLVEKTEGYSTEIPASNTDFIGQVSPRNPNERWTGDPNPNLPRQNDGPAGRKWRELRIWLKTQWNFMNSLYFKYYLIFYYLCNRWILVNFLILITNLLFSQQGEMSYAMDKSSYIHNRI